MLQVIVYSRKKIPISIERSAIVIFMSRISVYREYNRRETNETSETLRFISRILFMIFGYVLNNNIYKRLPFD